MPQLQLEGQAQKQNFRDWLDRTCPKVWDNKKVKNTNFKPQGFGFDEECKRREQEKIS
jgi:hypothetical protein